uniref:Methyltransferase n=1 Tax=Syphacia muris TaxID=451379 RepID=A0A0N5AZ44_9BILA
VFWLFHHIILIYLLTILLYFLRVLELGAGLGLPSIIANKCGAKYVMSTDQQLAVDLLKENIGYNIPNAMNIAVSVLDWKNFKLDTTYDVINSFYNFIVVLGADLVYKQELFEPLKILLDKCTNSSSVIIFASRIRYKKDELFYNNLNRTDFNVKKILYDEKADIHLYRIMKKIKN